MKKVTFLSLVVILLAVAAVPVMAKGNSTTPDSGVSAGRGNSVGATMGVGIQNRPTSPGNSENHGKGVGAHTQMGMRAPFYLQGTITAIDTTANTITVNLTHGNARVKQYIGTTLTVQTSDSTLFYQVNQGTGDQSDSAKIGASSSSSDDDSDMDRVPITFANLAVGQSVAIHGNLADNVYTAWLVTVFIQAPAGGSTGG